MGILRITMGVESQAQRGHIVEIARELGYAIIHAAGDSTVDAVVFADEGDMTLLGAHTIEGMNMRVDLHSKRLVPAGPAPAAAA